MKGYAKYQKMGFFVALLTLITLSCQGVAGFNPFATPTLTITPTPLLPPTPVPTGMKAEKQSDESTLFIDYDNKFQLTLPSDWVVIPLEKDDQNFSKIIELLAKDDSKLVNAVKNIRDVLDPKTFHMLAVPKDITKYTVSGFATNITVAIIDDETFSISPLESVVSAIEDGYKNRGDKVLTQGGNTIDNQNGVNVQFIDIERLTQTSLGATITVSIRFVIFQVNKKLIMISLATPKQLGTEILPTVNLVGESIKVMK